MSNYIGPKLRPDPLHTHAAIPKVPEPRRPAGDAAPRPARPIAHVHSNGEVCLERLPSSQVWPVSLYEYPAAHLPADEVLEKVERALRAVLAGSSRSSDGLMGWWNTPTIATMEQCDEALAALRSLRGNKT